MTWRIEVHDSLASTSELVRQRAAAGEPAGLAVIARRQEQGRGSFGRTWASPPGNLYVSVLLRPTGPLSEGGLWSLLTAVALADAVAPLLPDPAALRLKWPNDVLLDGAKLAGILLDSTGDASGHFASLVIGIGVNLATKPDLPDRPTACLADLAPPPTPDLMADRLLASLAHWTRIQSTTGFAPILQAWLARGPSFGTPLNLTQGPTQITGTFAGLAEDGRILIDTPTGRHPHAAGEIRLTP